MKAYSGRIKIECQKGPKPCPRKIVGHNVLPGCGDCVLAEVQVLDLDCGNLFTFPKAKPADVVLKPKKKKGVTNGL